MSQILWNKLPVGLLKKSFRAWDKLDHNAKLLVVRLATEQNFKCFFCDKQTGLFIEHEHYPGIRVKLSVRNIRGLVCPRCNQHISYLEQEELLSTKNFENAESNISNDELDTYRDLFNQRIEEFEEADLKREMGALRYSQRCLRLMKIRYWREWCAQSQRAHIAEAKLRQGMKHPRIIIPRLMAALKYAHQQFEDNPNYKPSDEVIAFLGFIISLRNQVLLSRAGVPPQEAASGFATGESSA